MRLARSETWMLLMAVAVFAAAAVTLIGGYFQIEEHTSELQSQYS